MKLVLIFAAAIAGAFAAYGIGLPIPFLLGSLIGTASLSMFLFARTHQRLPFPKRLRSFCIALIGAMIGTTFSPDALAHLPSIWITLGGMVVFIIVAELIGYSVYRHIGGYDRATATFAAMPGGLVEAVILGEKAGGNLETLSLQHFSRIIIIIMAVPLLFYLWSGEVVGSAAGQSLEKAPAHWQDWAGVFALAAVGSFVGMRLRIPAGHLMGPLALTAALHAGGWLDLTGPKLLLNGAQLVVGAGLGTNFAQTTIRRLLKGFLLGALSMVLVLAFGIGLSAYLAQYVPLKFETLVICYAPGGVTEMSLIALSLGVNPVIVAAHHLFRIIVTVSVAGLVSARMPRGS